MRAYGFLGFTNFSDNQTLCLICLSLFLYFNTSMLFSRSSRGIPTALLSPFKVFETCVKLVRRLHNLPYRLILYTVLIFTASGISFTKAFVTFYLMVKIKIFFNTDCYIRCDSSLSLPLWVLQRGL